MTEDGRSVILHCTCMVAENRPMTQARPYRLHRRLEAMDATRDRIVRATFGLHATVGPAQATISAIAERAGVERHTVYRHFPDIVTLIRACTAHGMATTGLPHPEAGGHRGTRSRGCGSRWWRCTPTTAPTSGSLRTSRVTCR